MCASPHTGQATPRTDSTGQICPVTWTTPRRYFCVRKGARCSDSDCQVHYRRPRRGCVLATRRACDVSNDNDSCVVNDDVVCSGRRRPLVARRHRAIWRKRTRSRRTRTHGRGTWVVVPHSAPSTRFHSTRRSLKRRRHWPQDNQAAKTEGYQTASAPRAPRHTEAVPGEKPQAMKLGSDCAIKASRRHPGHLVDGCATVVPPYAPSEASAWASRHASTLDRPQAPLITTGCIISNQECYYRSQSAEIDSVGSSSMDSVCDEGDLDLSADTWASSDIATFLAAPPLEGFDDDDDSAMLS